MPKEHTGSVGSWSQLFWLKENKSHVYMPSTRSGWKPLALIIPNNSTPKSGPFHRLRLGSDGYQKGWNHLCLCRIRLVPQYQSLTKAETWQQDLISDPNPKPGLSRFWSLSPTCTSPRMFGRSVARASSLAAELQLGPSRSTGRFPPLHWGCTRVTEEKFPL